MVYKLKPAAGQAMGLDRHLNVTRDRCAAALQQRITVYRHRGRTRG